MKERSFAAYKRLTHFPRFVMEDELMFFIHL